MIRPVSEMTTDTDKSRPSFAAIRTFGEYAWLVITAISFWMAILLPVLYIPLLTVAVDRSPVSKVFFGLLILHACAIVLGHEYGRP